MELCPCSCDILGLEPNPVHHYTSQYCHFAHTILFSTICTIPPPPPVLFPLLLLLLLKDGGLA